MLKWKKFCFAIILVFMLVLTFKSAWAYPVISYEQGVNVELTKLAVYYIPEEYYKYVDRIDFTNNFINNEWGHSYAKKNSKGNCYEGRIRLYGIFALEHELGHIYEYCELKQDDSTEEFAENFRIIK